MSTKAKKNGKEKKTAKEIAVIVFSVFIAIAMMVPSIGMIVNYYNSQNQENQPVTAEQVDETFTKLINAAEEKIKANPNDTALYNELGTDYIQWATYTPLFAQEGQDTSALVTERYNKALDAYNASLNISTTEGAVVGKAFALEKLNDLGQAESTLEDYLKDHPESTSAYQMLASIFELKGDKEQAIDAYQKVKEMSSDEEAKKDAQSAIDRLNNSGQSQNSEGQEQTSEESSENN